MCVRKEHGGMGFKDLYGFNLAMFGKQGWQLFTNHTTLVYRILKAKYFPHGNFLSAALGSNPSVTWRSIVEVRLTVLQGYRWKVGDGSQIKVWEDPWIRRDGCFEAESTSPIPDWDLRVSALLQPNGGEADKAVWHYSKYGEYTVRSAYRLLLERVGDMETLRCEGEWTKLWALKLPPKIKHFVWRVGRDVLPTRRKLQERHVTVPGECGTCATGIEDAWHLFLACDFANECWEEARLGGWVAHIRDRSDSFMQWFMIVLQEANDQQCKQALAIMWALWRERNARVWKSSTQVARSVVEGALETVAAWETAQQRRGMSERMPRNQGCRQWHPPPLSYVKCNTDAAYFTTLGKVGLGACIRDEVGNLLWYRTVCKRGGSCSKENEALAVWEGMKWCMEIGFDRVIFESDAQVVVDELGREVEDRREFGDIIRRCRSILLSKPGYSVCFVRRDGNQVAHRLAQQARVLASPSVGETIPHFLCNSLNDTCLEVHN
ncbi:Putative ribonuclease H protein At1g65750 [Linum grandiflorum]